MAVKDWRVLAGQAGYRAAELAGRCRVSLRELERFFLANVKQSPQAWLRAERVREALRLLTEGRSQKDVAGSRFPVSSQPVSRVGSSGSKGHQRRRGDGVDAPGSFIDRLR
jgi:AraC-like DNA-binding protein